MGYGSCNMYGKIYEMYVWVLFEKWILYDVKKYKGYSVGSYYLRYIWIFCEKWALQCSQELLCLFTKIFLQEKEECRCVYGQKNIWIFRIREQGNEHEMCYSVLKELRLGPLYIEPSM